MPLAPAARPSSPDAREYFLGIDAGAETLKVVGLRRIGSRLQTVRRARIGHRKQPGPALLDLLGDWDWPRTAAAATCGRFSRLLRLPRVPVQEAQALGFRALYGAGPATILSIGGHGFSVLELRAGAASIWRQNSRCSQGTGNFLRQLVGRFGLSVEEASERCATVARPTSLSGRCPVILKTDLTHLANQGVSRERVLAGLFDAVSDNALGLLRPHLAPPRVLLIGGVALSPRVRQRVSRHLAAHSMELLPNGHDETVFLEALGCAHFAAGTAADRAPPPLAQLLRRDAAPGLEHLPGLRHHLARVHRLPAAPGHPIRGDERCVLGLDIGSTGSKAVAVEIESRRPLWEAYVPTRGDPVAATRLLMQRFLESPVGCCPLHLVAVTGSGREIVGSLLAGCYGPGPIFILNEIAAHAAGALHFDRRVDTIFEIGGQDAKYIRLASGRVVEAAMNHACSAGTGSFIEEQGARSGDDGDLERLAARALAADRGVFLGQHCSVFMAEVIDQAVAAGTEADSILAGLYDSVIQNYLNRVKGARPVGRVVFCQGMPFRADALAAAVVKETGRPVVLPPNPGTVGALGIGLLAIDGSRPANEEPLDPQRFLAARLLRKDSFVCRSLRGCVPPGNHCQIARLTTALGEQRKRVTWGGSCGLWDFRGNRGRMPPGTPDPFRERAELLRALAQEPGPRRQVPRVALSSALPLADLLPFFTTLLRELGLDVRILAAADRQDLRRGIDTSAVPICAPMQVFQGMASRMAAGPTDYLFLPMLRSLPRVANASRAVSCPIVQGSADLVRWNLPAEARARVLSPVIDADGGLLSSEMRKACRAIARRVGASTASWRRAHRRAAEAQHVFDLRCRELGALALDFCQRHGIVPVVVLGRPYTLHDPLLNADVPTLLREQGALPIPVDCYPVDHQVPAPRGVYWAHGQRNLRAARQIAASPGVYGLWCSNYSCGPDSFNLHLFSELMDGKPFAVIETDGQVGVAGTRTRIEAFLYSIQEQERTSLAPSPDQRARDRPVAASSLTSRPDDSMDAEGATLADIRHRRERVLIPRMGPGAEVLAACLRGIGVAAEALAQPDRESHRLGQRYTSGKECLPFCVTLGSLLKRLEQEPDPEARFAFLMPTACGPCRFGVYHLLHRLALRRAGWDSKVRIWSPSDRDYFEGLPAGFAMLVMAGFSAMDVLLEAQQEVGPAAACAQDTETIYRRQCELLLGRIESAGRQGLSLPAALRQVATGRLFGCAEILRRAGAKLAGLGQTDGRPTVMLVGEVYVRCDPFSNDRLVERLEARGLHVRLAPLSEWLEYAELDGRINGGARNTAARLHGAIHGRIRERCWAAMGESLDWPPRAAVADALRAATPYIRPQLSGEATLTLGAPLAAWQRGRIDGAVSVVPLECMPGRIAEAQLLHAAEQEGLPSMTLSVSGEPVAPEVLDDFAFRIHTRSSRPG